MRIWINQGFSLHGLAAAIIAARPAVDLCLSAIDPRAPVRDVAPTFWIEPARDVEDYAGWVLETARAQRVDAVMVQRGRRAIAARAGEFEARGVRVHVAATAEVLDLLDDKAAFLDDLAGDPYLGRSIAVTSVAAFEAAVRTIVADGASACVKPVRGIYGAGYWTLDADDPFAHLADPDARRITPTMYLAGLRAREDRGDAFALLVMEHLPGLEASVDVVAQHGAVVLAAVRTKLDANRQRIETHHPLIAHAAMLVERYALHGAVNVQYRRDRHGDWRILEINTRPAGGASYLEAVGIPFAATWIDVAPGCAMRFAGKVDREILAVVKASPTPRLPVPSLRA